MTHSPTQRFALLLFALLMMSPGLAGCFTAPEPECAFACGEDKNCPSGYRCAGDGWCKRNDVDESFVCSTVSLVDAAAGGDGNVDLDAALIDAAPADAALIDAAVIDAAPIDAAIIDAAPIDAAPIDAAPIDAAPIDAAPIDAAPIDAAPIDAAPIDAATIDATPIDASTIDAS